MRHTPERVRSLVSLPLTRFIIIQLHVDYDNRCNEGRKRIQSLRDLEWKKAQSFEKRVELRKDWNPSAGKGFEMGRLIKNHWARLIILSAGACELGPQTWRRQEDGSEDYGH